MSSQAHFSIMSLDLCKQSNISRVHDNFICCSEPFLAVQNKALCLLAMLLILPISLSRNSFKIYLLFLKLFSVKLPFYIKSIQIHFYYLLSTLSNIYYLNVGIAQVLIILKVPYCANF